MVVDYDLEEHELALLRQAVTVVDRLEALDAIVEADGLMVEARSGPKLHPAAIESRQLKIALARLLAVLRLPAGEDGDHQQTARPQRRVGVRGAYGVQKRTGASGLRSVSAGRSS